MEEHEKKFKTLPELVDHLQDHMIQHQEAINELMKEVVLLYRLMGGLARHFNIMATKKGDKYVWELYKEKGSD